MKTEKLREILKQNFHTIRFDDDAVEMIDQRLLPERETYIRLPDPPAVAGAIREMVIRGAPAIGIAGAMGVALSALQAARSNVADADSHVREAARMLADVRPTAVNLAWGVAQALKVWEATAQEAPMDRARAVIAESERLLVQDIEICRAIGRNGAALMGDDVTILTHCNAGALATGGYGTALGVVRGVREAGKRVKVLADETRPFLQGARLTAWELHKDGFDVTVIPDSNAATFLRRGQVDAVVVGADRVARNGDAANKVGTYPVAVLAARHDVPFYVAAPVSTVDLDTPTGDEIPIEDRPAREVTHVFDTRIVPEGVAVANVAFDVTPNGLVRAIITEKGVFTPAQLDEGVSG